MYSEDDVYKKDNPPRVDQDKKPDVSDSYMVELAKAFDKGHRSTLSRELKLYLAGPEVFLPNAADHARVQKECCRKYGFIGLHPMDNTINISDASYDTAVSIYRGDVSQIRACDIMVANCNPFRGALMDDGTAYELGFGNALEKPSYGYIHDSYSYNQRMIDKGQGFFSPSQDRYIDCQHYLLVDDFGTSINLMMQCGMTEHGGRLIHGSFEDCLKAIREDIDNGVLVVSGR